MNFTVERAVASGGRLGRISQITKNGNVTLETPLCTLFTKGGSAPYLSLSMLGKIGRVPEIATISINSLTEQYENIREFKQGLAEFTALKKIVFGTLNDVSVDIPSGKNTKTGIAVWGKGGKTQIDPHLYMKMQEAFQPDWFQALSDGDTDHTCVRKRLSKAVDRTLDFLDGIVEIWEKSEVLKNSSLIGVVEGGFNEEERKRSALETSARPVHGFLIEGFQKCYTEDVFTNESFLPLLTKTISYLPENKPRIMDVAWTPLQVIRAFKHGLDIFSGSYPHLLTDKGKALDLDFTLPPKSNATILEATESLQSQTESTMAIDLKDKRYFDDFSPLVNGCTCYTCSNFNRSYVHHLLNTSELLAYVLLTIHNFHKYFEFFHVLREAARADRIDELEESLCRQSKDDAGS